MTCFAKAALVFISSWIQLSTQSPVDIPDIKVSQNERLTNDDSLGIVYGTRPCGGNGQLLQWRLEGCNTTDVPCQFPADEKLRRSVMEFVPSANIDQLGVRIIMSVNGSEPMLVYEKPLPNSEVVVGIPATITASGRVAKEIRNMFATGQYILYDVEREATEVCAEADFEFV